MKKVKETLGSLCVILLLFALGFGTGVGGCLWHQAKNQTAAAILQPPADLLQLPGETEKYIVTLDEIEVALQELQEFATYSGTYQVSKSEDVWRCLDDRNLWLTRNTVAVACEGVVKVGYDVNLIAAEIDEKSETVYLRLPPVSVLDNYVIWDTVDASGSVNNLLHPLSFDEYREVISRVEEEGLEKVTESGIFEHAEESFRRLVTAALAGVTDYRIVFL